MHGIVSGYEVGIVSFHTLYITCAGGKRKNGKYGVLISHFSFFQASLGVPPLVKLVIACALKQRSKTAFRNIFQYTASFHLEKILPVVKK